MQSIPFIFRPETPNDYSDVENLTREAFWNKFQPGCVEHYLLHILRESENYLPELHYLAVLNLEIIGSIVYSRSKVISSEGTQWQMLTFGPFSVLPAYQRKGVGAALIDHTISVAQKAGERAILIFGDPSYYSRFGFLPASTFGITLPDDTSFDAFQALELHPNALASIRGKFYDDDAFHSCDAASVDAYDNKFPQKTKLRLPGQMWASE